MKNSFLILLLFSFIISCSNKIEKPNIVFVFADQWRAQSMGYAGNPDVNTPNLDKLASEGVSFTNTISTNPVCTPYRAMLLTGQYPLKTGMFMNDILLNPDSKSFAKLFKQQGYNTAYIGKWHLDGNDTDPYQLNNLIGNPAFESLAKNLNELLSNELNRLDDEFLTGPSYIEKWGHNVNSTGTVPYEK